MRSCMYLDAYYALYNVGCTRLVNGSTESLGLSGWIWGIASDSWTERMCTESGHVTEVHAGFPLMQEYLYATGILKFDSPMLHLCNVFTTTLF